ncbi:MAG TPA: ABC transporter permease [Thermodesulfobacteriota bacterium]|nr:ABC transporter permease [Thermodesulfobacteriota bacterium]
MTIRAIAGNTFREAIRDRILYGLLAFALFMIATSLALASLSVGQQERITKDLGLAAISLIGVLMAVFLGVSLVSREVERRTVYVVLSKPVGREQFVLGKYLGLAATVGVNVLVMGTGLALLTAVHGWWDAGVAAAVYLTLLELLLLIGLATLFSTFTTPTLSAIFTLGLFVVGHLSGSLRAVTARASSEAIRLLGEALYRLLPNLEAFNVRGRVAHGEAVGLAEIGAASAYGALYLVAVLALAVLVFRRRELP